MLPTAIIVFREVLEAALIVGIVMAASRGAVHRGLWVSGGILAGVLGATAVAGGAATIAAVSILYLASLLLVGSLMRAPAAVPVSAPARLSERSA